MGSSREPVDSRLAGLAHALGRQIAFHDALVLTGGCTGLPRCAVMGAVGAGGMTIAISPAINSQSHVTDFGYPIDSEVTIFTGMGNKGRNVVLVRSCDACIFISGGMGTLNEFTVAHDDFAANNIIGVLEGTGGLSGKYLELAANTERKTRATIIADTSPQDLVTKIIKRLKTFGDL